MKTSRQRILEYLEVKGAASVLDISRALHLTSANIRRHLSILLQQGTVEVIGEHKCGQAGRPARRYAPTRRVSAHNLDSLADILLQELVECTLPSEDRDC